MLNVPAIWWHNRTHNGVTSCSWKTVYKASWQVFTYIHFHICIQAENWTLQKVDQEYLVSSEMSCWRRMENISWVDSVRNKEVLHRFKRERNILYAIKRIKANWTGYLLRRNCLWNTLLKEKQRVEVTGRRGTRHKRVLDDLEEKRWYCKLKEKWLWKRLWNCSKTTERMNPTPTKGYISQRHLYVRFANEDNVATTVYPRI